MDQDSPIPAAPPAATVAGNRWVDIDVPELGHWTPSRTVTVVIPYFERQDELERTLAALTEQTYPRHLMEIIIVDDGSESEPVLPAFADVLDVTVKVQEDRGYGLARARNLGARTASGEILIFVDCDMIAERRHVEAHARWHHTVSNAMVFGFRWHADFTSFDPAEIAEAVAADDVRRLVDEQGPQRPEWIERQLLRTDTLTGPFDDFFLVTSGGNLSIRRDLYLEVGGNNESFTQWGGEDNEFGFRVMQAGAVIVPERQAVCWHQGEGYEHTPEEVRSHQQQSQKMKNMIAELGYREPQPGCSYTVPYAVVAVDGTDAPVDATVRTVESILGSRFHDLVVVAAPPADDYEETWLRWRFAGDDRVRISDDRLDAEAAYRFSPLRVAVPSGALLDETTMGLIADRVKASGVGLLQATLPGTDPAVATIVATATRAVNRARRITAAPDQVEPLIGELFGERWVSGRSLGIGMIGESDVVTEPDDHPVTHTGVDDSGGDARRITALEQENADMRSRRALRLADAAGSLKSARTKQDLTFSLGALWRAIRDPAP